MRIHFGTILPILMRRRINENMVWTDSQDYGADEILYTIGTVLFNTNNRLMREIAILFEVYPQLFSCSQLFQGMYLSRVHNWEQRETLDIQEEQGKNQDVHQGADKAQSRKKT